MTVVNPLETPLPTSFVFISNRNCLWPIIKGLIFNNLLECQWVVVEIPWITYRIYLEIIMPI